MVILPDAPWRHRAGLDTLVAALDGAGGGARFVGGAVRDTLLGLPVADIDIATRFAPAEVIDRLAEYRIKAVPTGIAHGTITAVLESGPVEVTTLRRDVATDGRHAVVTFTDDWREDAARRDFTMNALFADPVTGDVIDYFAGLADLDARRVRFIGDPLQRIAEDHLRILRFFRFLARFGDTPDAAALDACTTRANDLMALSRERIRDELLKLLVAPGAVAVLSLMIERGILLPVLPEITSSDPLARLAQRETVSDVAPDALRRLVALLPADQIDTVAARLKLSNAERKRLILAAMPTGNDDARALAYRSGTQGAVDRLLLTDRPVADVRSVADWPRPAFPVSGGTLVAHGIGKGPDVARTLRRIEDRWIIEDFPGPDRLAAIVAEEVDQALRSIRNA